MPGNEWGEGAYLEPDNKFGWQYLEATSRALRGYVPIRETQPYRPIRKPIPCVWSQTNGWC
jgi:hypothetical protein